MMICTIILFSYLITCCTHLVTLAKTTTSSTTPAPIVIHQHQHLHNHKHLPAGWGAGERPEVAAGGGWRDESQQRAIKVHKLMSEQDLRRTFQVDSHDQVPEYEVLTISNKLEPEQERQLLACSTSSSSSSSPSASNYSNNISNNDTSTSPNDKHPVVKLKLSTFGKQFKLRLKRNVDFQQRIKDMKMFMAESTQDGKLRYTEVRQAAGNSPASKQKREDAQAGKLLEDLQGHLLASHLQQANHTTYHDEENLAALLIDHDKRTGRLQLDGTIGNDFVIKPLPETSSRALEAAHAAKEAALNKEAASGARPEVSHHVVFRQKPSSEESSSEHRHSFMVSPGERLQASGSMEQIALSFNTPKRAPKLSDDLDPASNLVEPADSADLDREESEAEPETDFAHDPLGGQFQLEPGLENLIDGGWSLHSRQPNKGSSTSSFNRTTSEAQFANSTSNNHRRFKRHIRGRAQPVNPRPAGSQVRRKRQAPDTVWPEVLLVVDYDSFLLHGGDSRDVKRYFVSFWNGVDLRYKLLVHPHIRISLAGMIVAKDRDATPYLERNRLRAPNADAVDAAGALTDMGKYLYREDRLPTYDLAVVITKLDMCRRRYEGGRCNRGTAGFAYVGGACVVNKRLEKVNSVAIIEDSGGFSGIIVAAHEVGHLLGCVHDGSPPPSYLGGPGATHCPWEDGFIMSDLRHTERGFRWSQCSVEQFKHFLNGETATCLYNYPHESQMLHRLSPGTMLSLDEQCKRDRGTNACFKDARVCAQLFCFDSASGYCVSYRPAAEGSPCGEGQVCRNGKCVGEIENIIPDYTHQSQTIVAPSAPIVANSGAPAGQVAQRQLRQSARQLADNGPSASSTSLTATSAPDSAPKLTAADAAISSRMDTLPIDLPMDPGPGSTPTLQAASHPAGQHAARFAARLPAGSHHKQTTLAASSGRPKSSQALAKHAPRLSTPQSTSGRELEAASPARHPSQANYQQRSGHQALPKATGANKNNNNNNSNRPLINPTHYTSNLNDHHRAAPRQQYYQKSKVY